MRIQSVLTGELFEARLTTEHSASSYDQPVLVADDGGDALSLFAAAFYRLVQGTAEEREALLRAGYRLLKRAGPAGD